jgi:hypothetical protein
MTEITASPLAGASVTFTDAPTQISLQITPFEHKNVVLYSSARQDPEAAGLIEAAHVLQKKAEEKYTGMLIESAGDAEVLLEFRARANAVKAKLDKKRLELGEGLRTVLATLNLECATDITKLETIVKDADATLKAWQKKQDDERAEQLRLQREEEDRVERERIAAAQQVADAQKLAATATTEEDKRAATELVQEAQHKTDQLEHRQETLANIPAPAPVSHSIRGSHGSSGGLRDNWTWELVDITQVPEAYLKAPEDRLNRAVITAHVKSNKDAVPIAGIKIKNDAVINTRVAR